MRYICTSIVATLVLAGTSLAATINVPGDYVTIQEAIDAANDGDEIVVEPGTYTGSGDQVVNTLGKGVTLRSSYGPEVTIIDGENARRGIACFNDESNATVIDGFTFANGESNDGGGIFISTSSPYLSNCIITNNSATLGGGIYCGGNSSPVITSIALDTNTAFESGGAIYVTGSTPAISNCTITANSANLGSGITCHSNSNSTITNCTIFDNTASSGGGIYCYFSSPTVTDCNITDNWATLGGGIFCDSSNPILTGSTVCGNTPNQIHGSYLDEGGNFVGAICETIGSCCIGGSCIESEEDTCVSAGGTFTTEDCSACPGPEAELGACCINGICVPTTLDACYSVNGNYAGDGVTCDEANCPTYCHGDTNQDGTVNMVDLLTVIADWGICP